MPDQNFFHGGQLPEDFSHAASGDAPEPETRPPDSPDLEYNPPELVLGSDSHQISDITREQLNPSERDAINEARERMNNGESELGDHILQEQFRSAHSNGNEQKSEPEVERQDLPPTDAKDMSDLSDQELHEYDQWALDLMQHQYDERWQEKDTIEHAEDFQQNMLDQLDSHAQDRGPDLEH